ncbi:armadillo-type protein, partial [Phycomyces blakesleeanus]
MQTTLDQRLPKIGRPSATTQDRKTHLHLELSPLRRPRADTMPSQSTAFLYIPEALLSLDTNIGTNPIGNHPFGGGIFNSSFLADGTQLLSPTTPTTDQLMKGDDNNTITSTLASLGLQDDMPWRAQPSQVPSQVPLITTTGGEEEASSSIPTTLPSIASVRLQQSQGRPRAISMGTHHSNFSHPNKHNLQYHNRPSRNLLRSSNSSADLLEMIARQRKAASDNLNDIINNEDDNDEDDDHSSSSEKNSPVQIPTRSLWLGNIDPSITTADLTCLFTPCGPIDSIRILPDRECAFVNFESLEDALRAKESATTKLSSRLGSTSLKVGFGRHEAVPQPVVVTETNTSSAQGPTRALWIGNIPVSTTPNCLLSLFSPFGSIESARVLTHKNCGFVNFELQEDAVRAKKALIGKEIMGPGSGPVRIGFAKEPSKLPVIFWITPTAPDSGYQSQRGMMCMTTEMVGTTSPNVYAAVVAERQLIMREFGDYDRQGSIFDEIHRSPTYYSAIIAAPELGQSRRVDISRLREFRKKLESPYISLNELDVIAVDCTEEIVELCSDYIGNTVVQRLFERCSETAKSHMLETIAPYLASVGIHKNGTWAAQKIIDTARLPTQINTVCVHIRPYVPALLLDQFGNYVVQCCLGLGPDINQFIFDAIVDNCWEIAQGRFGSRAVRATLESPHVTKRQQKYVASTLVQHALLLATNANGALLLIWFLDTSGIPGRYSILAPRLTPHLARLCTHKLASLTVLKLVNQRQEPEACTVILDTLFFSPTDTVIDEVLQDQVHGVSLVQKVLSSSYVDLKERQRIAERV